MQTFTIDPSDSDIQNALADRGRGIDLAALAGLTPQQRAAVVRPREREESRALFNRLDPDMVADCRSKGMFFSEYLELEDPTDPASEDAILGRDSFRRMVDMLRTAPDDLGPGGQPIRVASDPKRGIPATSALGFIRAGTGDGKTRQGLALWEELMRRTHAAASRQGIHALVEEDRFYASSNPLWPGLIPQYLTQPITNAPRFRPSLLPQMLAIQTVVVQDVFKFPDMDGLPVGQRRFGRVGEGTPPPVVRLSVSSREGHTYGYGVSIEITDQVARRVPIDWVRYQVALIGNQNLQDKELVAGEAAINYGLESNNTDSGIDGTANVIDATPIDNFLSLFEADGYQPTICVGLRADTTALKNATTGSADHMLFRGRDPVLNGGARTEELTHPGIYTRPWAPAGKLVYLDGSRALAEATETGTTTQETDRDIRTGITVVVIREQVGYFPLDQKATRLLDYKN